MSLHCLQLACFFCFLVLHVSDSSSEYCKLQEHYLIRNEPSGLVLEADDVTRAVTLQAYTGHSPQLWVIENGAKPGYFYIVNKKNGKVLDVGQKNHVEINVRNDALSQQWYIHLGGNFPNVQYEKMLDVLGGHLQPGKPLGIWKANGLGPQKFLLQKIDVHG